MFGQIISSYSEVLSFLLGFCLAGIALVVYVTTGKQKIKGLSEKVLELKAEQKKQHDYIHNMDKETTASLAVIQALFTHKIGIPVDLGQYKKKPDKNEKV